MTLTQCLEEKHFPLRRESLRVQFLEGVAFLHKHGVAHLDLKPGNVLVHGSSSSLLPCLSIIDFGLLVIAESEETLVEGYCGTPSWAALEVRESAEKYSAILADRWSCGKVLKYFVDSLPIGSASAFEPICTRLLSSVPGERPSLSAVLQVLRCTPDPYRVRAEKRGSEVDEATAVRKRHRIVW
ncbi:kinase-like domain-containing protein [Lactarius akahatsu]|uniref:Kinase-like domain-containing protein n=1 Tax=Lactarius akahatsu TaxID=416441 RepID=A0AAD4LUF4_9AGAM|nr:kinase-like domain-containing protein [Lactarius akahatsu]KAH8999748.1 kinase-like domain-containing protein [Lactarius akahatsu]